MNILWHKVWADLWLYKSRTLLAIVSIAVGIFGVGTLFGMIDLLLNKMDTAHRLSAPSHINLILRNSVDHSWLKQIADIPGVKGVDSMTQLSVRYQKPEESEWQTATLMVRAAPGEQKFDKSTLQSGNWPQLDQLAIERMSAQSTGLQTGDTLAFDTGEGVKNFQLSGIVSHPFVKPPKFGGQTHFFIDNAHAEQFGLGKQTFRQLLVQITPPYEIEKARVVAEKIYLLLNKNNITVNATLMQDPEKHWGRPFLAGVNLILKIMAVSSLVLASVLIFNTLSAHVTQQTEQIGVMKSLGGSTLTIARVYLYQALLMGIVAVVMAMPLALLAAFFSSCKLLSLFNISCVGFSYSISAIDYMLLSGVLVPLVAGLVPIYHAATMPVRKAMASYGLGPDFGSSRFDLYLEKIAGRFLPTLYAAALGNFFRRKGRLILTQSVLIIAGMMFLVLMSLIASVNLTLNKEMARSHYDLKLGFSVDQPKQKVVEIAQSLASTETVEAWQRLPMLMSKQNVPLHYKGSLGAELLAMPSSSSMYQPFIEQGRWFQVSDAGTRVMVVSADTAKINHLKIGDLVSMQLAADKADWQIIGIYRWLTGSSYALEPVYAPLQTAIEMTGRANVASLLLLDARINTQTQEIDYVKQLKQKFQAQGIKINPYNTHAKFEQRQFILNQFKPVLSTLLGLAAMIACIGGIGLSGILIIGVQQRTREIGVLRAIGAPSKAIFALFLLEGLLHGAFAWLICLPLAYVTAEPVTVELGNILFGIRLDFIFDYWASIYWMGIISLIALFAAYWPALKATQLTVRESFTHGS